LAWRQGLFTSWGLQEATAEEIEVRPAKHLALQHFQPIDMPLHGARIPGQRHARFDRRIVVVETLGKALWICSHDTGHMWEAISPRLCQGLYVKENQS
jgi:hypothetical protein